MALPKISHPTFEVVVPSLKRKIKMRMMLVKEEKILLMAKESDGPTDVMNAIKQVVTNCIVDPIDANKLTVFDLEYLFLKLRAASVDNVTKVSYRDNEDNEVYDFEIDLSKVEVNFPENVNQNIKVNDKIGIIMKWPEASVFDDPEIVDSETGDTSFDMLIIKCIDKVYEGDTSTDASTVDKKELIEFIDSLDVKVFEDIRKFLINIPQLKYEIKYTNKMGNERKITLSTLDDFFTLR